MSAHFSKFSLNTYPGTPYFGAHVPADYPLSLVLQASRAFRRLPPNLRTLAELSRQWAAGHGWGDPNDRSIDDYYDAAGRELDPDTGVPLTDAEIDAQWGGRTDPDLARFRAMDIVTPDGGAFPDPRTWEPAPEPTPAQRRPLFTDAQLRSWVESHGADRVSRDFGIPIDQLPR